MMSDVGLIKGIKISIDITGETDIYGTPRITLKGLEYLTENSLMKKAYEIAKGIKEVVPGL